MNILLVGNGAWGKNYVRTINDCFPNIKLKIADRTNWWQLIDEKPHGVIIATQPDSHVKIALQALGQNIPCLIEKPLALSLAEAKKLEQFSHIPILVGHIHLFSNWYQKIKYFVKDEEIINIFTQGTNNTEARNYSALWDYGPHDLAIILDLIQFYPTNIEIKKFGMENNNSFFKIYMSFKDLETESIVGKIWEKKRHIFINCSSGVKIEYNFSTAEKYKPPMQNMLEVFFAGINGKSDYRFGLQQSFDILRILETYKEQ